jgi:hypothetical protein
MVGGGLGMALGGWLGGSLFDVTGDYTWALLTSLVVGCLGLPLALALPRHGKTPPGSLGKTIATSSAAAALPASAHRPA